VELKPYQRDRFKVGDKVRMHDDGGSWVNGKEGEIIALNVTSPDSLHGHCIRVEGVGVTVVPWHQLERM
jgi:hypothetical protein